MIEAGLSFLDNERGVEEMNRQDCARMLNTSPQADSSYLHFL